MVYAARTAITVQTRTMIDDDRRDDMVSMALKATTNHTPSIAVRHVLCARTTMRRWTHGWARVQRRGIFRRRAALRARTEAFNAMMPRQSRATRMPRQSRAKHGNNGGTATEWRAERRKCPMTESYQGELAVFLLQRNLQPFNTTTDCRAILLDQGRSHRRTRPV